MKSIALVAFLIILIGTRVFCSEFKYDSIVLAGNFDDESSPNDPDNVRSEGGKISYIPGQSWVVYRNFDFGSGSTYFWIEASTNTAGGTLEVRTDSLDGPVISTIQITNTGGWSVFRPFGSVINPPVSQVKDLFFKFVGESGFLYDLRSFSLLSTSPGLKQPNSNFDTKNFDSESAPNAAPIVVVGNVVGSVTNGSWVTYNQFDFDEDSNVLSIEAATPGVGGTVEVRLGSPTGELVGSIEISHTGSWTHYRPFTGVLTKSVSGVQNLCFKFVDSRGTGTDLFQLRGFTLSREVPTQILPYIADDDQDGVAKILEYVHGMHPSSKDVLPLKTNPRSGTNINGSHDIELRLRADNSMATVVLVSQNLETWERVTLIFQDGSWQVDHPYIAISEVIPLADQLFTIRLKDSRSHTKLFVRMSAQALEGDLNVYPPVPGLDASPYYTFSVQKLSVLNSTTKENATNWQNPFAWFTRCVDFLSGAMPGKTAYYSDFIGSWSHTYCNFEVDEHTPIVVKIQRLNKAGAPSGPITRAAVHPAHKVDSCEIINGDVYVTMSQPALIAVDIDGQMDLRDAPRATPTGWDSTAFPYRNEMDAAHGITIFANPFIEDKPQLGAPGVYAVEPGTKPPTDGSWTTLYFKPGVHKFSVDAFGNEREWQTTDPLFLTNNKSYYIPGDTIIYGNLHDNNDDEVSSNIRVFGHGTISGTKIPHWQDFSAGRLPDSDHKKLRMLHLSKATNCNYEGITIADPAEHGAYIEGREPLFAPNYIKWLKNINWRVNNDGGGVTGNSYVEDCFFRHQDDALYVRGMAIRRTVMWSDVNGTPFRCSFINSDRGVDFPTSLPQDFIVEDCDVIYARGVFALSDATDNGIIGTPSAYDNQKTYADGTLNTGQHLIFRNIRISDPRPVRYLFGFHPTKDATSQHETWAGIRFENIDYMHPQRWGWKNRFIGSASGPIHHMAFEKIKIGGQPLNFSFFNDPNQFETAFTSEMIFK